MKGKLSGLDSQGKGLAFAHDFGCIFKLILMVLLKFKKKIQRMFIIVFKSSIGSVEPWWGYVCSDHSDSILITPLNQHWLLVIYIVSSFCHPWANILGHFVHYCEKFF